MKKRLKVNGIIMVCAAIALVFFPRFFLRTDSREGWEEIIEVLGFSLILLGQLIRVCARGYKAENSVQSQALIQGGPYQVVRNPMYLGILLIGLGVVMALFQVWAAVIFILVFVFRYTKLIYKEEKKLGKIFPKEYAEYRKRVPRIFPSAPSLIKLDIRTCLPMKLAWFKKEIGSITTLLLLTLLAESWEDIAKDGIVVYLGQFIWFLLTFILFVIFVIFLSKWTQKNEKISN